MEPWGREGRGAMRQAGRCERKGGVGKCQEALNVYVFPRHGGQRRPPVRVEAECRERRLCWLSSGVVLPEPAQASFLTPTRNGCVLRRVFTPLSQLLALPVASVSVYISVTEDACSACWTILGNKLNARKRLCFRRSYVLVIHKHWDDAPCKKCGCLSLRKENVTVELNFAAQCITMPCLRQVKHYWWSRTICF